MKYLVRLGRGRFGGHKQISFLALPTKALKDIVFGFIIEYSSLRDFGPKAIGLFLYEDF
jgi:hypothetical protein